MLELLGVILIIGVLAAAALSFHADTGAWPPPSDSLPYGAGFLTNDDGAGNPVPGWSGPYLKRWSSAPWGQPYHWDHKEVDADASGLEWVVEVGFMGLPQQQRDLVAGLMDRTIDEGDGPCAGIFRGSCPPGPGEWASWPS